MTHINNDWVAFEDASRDCSFTGENAAVLLVDLTNRVKTKRLKTATRLLRGLQRLGACIEFCSGDDGAEDNPFDEEGCETCRGLFTEDDSWIYLNLDFIRSWKAFEEVLAHEAVHFLQLLLNREERRRDESNLSVYLSKCWAFDEAKYLDWLSEHTTEGFPVFEVEAYTEMVRPRGVACALEHSYHNSKLWENTWYCPLGE